MPGNDGLAFTRRSVLAALGFALLGPRAEAASLAPLARVLVELDPPQEPPPFTFMTANAEPRTLTDYRGQGLVLNIWATWCVPCLAEMPALNRLSVLVQDFSISVLPVSIDAKGLVAVKAYYAAHGIGHLPILLDPDGSIADAFHVDGIPASFIINRRGWIVAKCLGAAQWDAPGAVATIRRLTSEGNERA